MTSTVPPGPDNTHLARLHGPNPNGMWSALLEDDASKDTSSVNGYWRLHITTGIIHCFLNPDSDGLMDLQEAATGLNPADPGDTEVDADGDGFPTRQEYMASTSGSIPIRDPDAAGRSE